MSIQYKKYDTGGPATIHSSVNAAREYQSFEDYDTRQSQVLNNNAAQKARMKPVPLFTDSGNDVAKGNTSYLDAPAPAPAKLPDPVTPEIKTDGKKGGWENANQTAAVAGGAMLANSVGNALNSGGVDPRAGSTLSGAASGAMAGMVLGPWGAVVGGVVGGAIGFFKGKKEKDGQDEAQKQAILDRKEQESILVSKRNNAMQAYSSGRTQSYMDQADSLYGGTGKTIGIARRGGIVYSPVQVLYYTNDYRKTKVDMPIKARRIQKAYKGGKVALNDRVLLCSRADNSCSFKHKSESPFHSPLFRRGGSIVNKMKKNIIPHGVLHEEENNTGVKGDKGIPIVQNGEKMFELERSELVLNADVSNDIVAMVYKYKESPDDELLVKLGKKIQKEILLNTYSYDPEYAEALNH